MSEETTVPDRRVLHVLDGPELEVLRLGSGGPRATILGGVHGDEWEGVIAARALVDRLARAQLLGTVTVLPRSNPPALDLDTRLGPDGKNLARSFPGRGDGGLTERVAATIAPLIDEADLLVDLHSAGRNYLMPPLIGLSDSHLLGGRGLLETALRTPMPFVWVHPGIGPGRSISRADARGIPWVYFESGCGGALTQRDIDRYVDSVLLLLSAAGVLPPVAAPEPPADRVVVVDGDGNTDTGVVSEIAGRFVRRVEVGQVVGAGEEIGGLHDDLGRRVASVSSIQAGRIMMLRHEQRVLAGDVLAIVATEEGSDAA